MPNLDNQQVSMVFFLKNTGPKTKKLIVVFFNDILATGKLPKLFKQVKVITILMSLLWLF
jgi:hypothetical protein